MVLEIETKRMTQRLPRWGDMASGEEFPYIEKLSLVFCAADTPVDPIGGIRQAQSEPGDDLSAPDAVRGGEYAAAFDSARKIGVDETGFTDVSVAVDSSPFERTAQWVP